MSESNILANMGYSPTRNQAQYARQIAALKANVQMETEKEEKKQKRMKDMLDFYKTVREYFSPAQAYKATKEKYPDFDAQGNLTQENAQVDYKEQLGRLGVAKAQKELEQMPREEERKEEEHNLKSDYYRSRTDKNKAAADGGMGGLIPELDGYLGEDGDIMPGSESIEDKRKAVGVKLRNEEKDRRALEKRVQANMKFYGRSRQETIEAMRRKGLL